MEGCPPLCGRPPEILQPVPASSSAAGMNQAHLVSLLRTRARRSAPPPSQFRGVSSGAPGQEPHWAAHITIGSQSCHLGAFATELEAAVAYDK